MFSKKKLPRDPVILERQFHAKGSVIIQAGTDSKYAYLIQSGSVEVYTYAEEEKVKLGVLNAGEIFGEGALFPEAKKRNAYVEALEDTNVILITTQVLQDKLAQSDPTIRAIMQMLMKRVETGNEARLFKGLSAKDLRRAITQICQNVYENLGKSKKALFKGEIMPLIEEIEEKLQDYIEDEAP